VINKNRPTRNLRIIHRKAENQYMLLATIIAELSDTYPTTIEEVFEQLKREKHVHPHFILQVQKRLNHGTTPNSRPS
jgi:hypothetical protein